MIQRKFNIGNSTDGPLGMVIRANGETVEDAIKRVPQIMDSVLDRKRPDVEFDGEMLTIAFDDCDGEYLLIYVALNNLRAEHEDPGEAEEMDNQ